MLNKFYPKLFEKGRIGNLTVKNRIIRNSMGTYLANPDCSVTINNVKAAAQAAEGGAGLVFMDNVVIKDMYHMGLSAADDTYIPGLAMMAEAIQDHGALAGMQLAHPGRDTGFVGGTEIVSASRITFEPWYEAGAQLPKELTIEEIHTMVQKYGEAALRVRKAGWRSWLQQDVCQRIFCLHMITIVPICMVETCIIGCVSLSRSCAASATWTPPCPSTTWTN